MKTNDKIFQLSSDLIDLQKAYNKLLSEKDEIARSLAAAMKRIEQQEKLLDRAVQFRKNPSKKPQG